MGDVNNTEVRELTELPSGFEMDIDEMALMNLKSALVGIDSLERTLLESTAGEDEETVKNMARNAQFYCESLRLNACRMAAVMLVARLQVWIAMFMKDAQLSATKARKNDPSMLVLQLRALNQKLGDGPVPLAFFDELEEFRNSVLHADLAVEWESKPGRWRRVANRYDSGANVEMTADQIKDAVSKTVQQIKWYEVQLKNLRAAEPGPA